MKKLFIILIIPLFIGCITQRNFLVDPDKTLAEKPKYSSRVTDFNSAISIQENSIVEVGVWEMAFGIRGRRIFRYDIKITNNAEVLQIVPDEIIVFDADNISLNLLSPRDYVYFIEGTTPEESLTQSIAFSNYATQLQASQNCPTVYGYSSVCGNFPGTYGTYTPYRSSAQSFSSGFAGGYALGSAIKASKIRKAIREAEAVALMPSTLPTGKSNAGRIYSLAGTLPIELHVFASGNHHILKLIKLSGVK